MNLTQIKWLTLFALLINAVGMMTPIINAGDSVTYAALSQHMVLSGEWMDLVLDGQEWLDKPHFPFWMTALSFKLFGISAFTYILPGFVFHLLGGYFTYRIARLFYGREAAWLALLVYVSVFHLMYTSSEVKAETYLTGSIMGACYYWLRYDTASKLKYLLLGALFSGIAVMTKGVFTLITITSGLVCMWMFQKQWHKLWSGKWLLALLLSVLFTAPEVLAVYLQFDVHPEKVVFGETHVSGIKFFLWDSQFGRFFNTGPIKNTTGTPFYFMHVFLWAFLPWVVVYLLAMVAGVRGFVTRTVQVNSQFVFLGAAFLVTFALFSATGFQLDHYTVIVFPFAAIVCGKFLLDSLSLASRPRLLYVAQLVTTLLMLALVLGLSVHVGNKTLLLVIMVMMLTGAVYAYRQRAEMTCNVVLVFPVFAVVLLYVFLTLLMTLSYLAYSVPYNANKVLATQSTAPIYALEMDIVSRELALYNAAPCFAATNRSQLPTSGAPYYLLIRAEQLAELGASLGKVEQLGQGQWVVHKTGMLPRLLQLARGEELLEDIRVVRVTPVQ